MTENADHPDECDRCGNPHLEALPAAGIYAERWRCPACGAGDYRLRDDIMP